MSRRPSPHLPREPRLSALPEAFQEDDRESVELVCGGAEEYDRESIVLVSGGADMSRSPSPRSPREPRSPAPSEAYQENDRESVNLESDASDRSRSRSPHRPAPPRRRRGGFGGSFGGRNGVFLARLSPG